MCVSPSARRQERETESDREQTGRERGSRRRGAARGWMLEHRACCVDLIKFSSVLFAVGLVTQLYLCSAVCWGWTTLTQISGRTGGLHGIRLKSTFKKDTSKFFGGGRLALFVSLTVYPLPLIPQLIHASLVCSCSWCSVLNIMY